MLMQRGINVTSDMAADLLRALTAEGCEFLVAPYEADSQMAALAEMSEAEGGVSAVITEDSDLLCYAAVQSVLFKLDRYKSTADV
jgi:exonuclease-1